MGQSKELFMEQREAEMERERMARVNPQTTPTYVQHWMTDALRYHYELLNNVKKYYNGRDKNNR